MFSDLFIAVIWGIVITLFLEILGVLVWFYSISDTAPSPVIPINDAINTETPQSVNRNCYERFAGRQQAESNGSHDVESCHWLNCLIDFGFHQLRDSSELKKLMMKQINKEFTELLLTKTEGKMLERLSVREYNMGTCLPVLSKIAVVKAEKDDDETPKIVEVEMDVEYNGGFQLSIDADLVFNKAAFVSVKVNKVRGRGRLQFSTAGFTHWSFAFLNDPELDLTVGSRFEGRELSQLSAFLKAQIIRWVKRFHTLPNYKVRFKPFFKKIKYQDQMLDVHIHDSRITRGELYVKIIECSKLMITDTAVELYCTASVGDTPKDAQVGYWQGMWPCREIQVCRSWHEEHLGIKYSLFPCSDEGRKSMVIITSVAPHSPAHHSGIKTGDILQKIENVNVTGVQQANKLIKNARGLRLLITIRRPTVNIFKLLEQRKLEYEDSLKKRKYRSKSPNPTKQTKGAANPIIADTKDEVPRKVEVEEEEEEEEEDDGDEEGGGTHRLRVRDREGNSEREDEEGLIHNSGLGIRNRKMRMKERALSSPPYMHVDTDSHRPLATSLESDDLRGSLPVPNPSKNVLEPPNSAVNSKSHDISLESHDSHKTKSVSVTRNPKWRDEFRYSLAPGDQYLNVCVWSRLQGEDRNFMIGSVTISLADVALECATSGHHKQRYVLLPNKNVRTSKLALKVAMSDFPSNAKIGKISSVQRFVGDILLSFKHEPQEVREDVEDLAIETPMGNSSCFSNTETENTSKFEVHPFTAEKGTEPYNHCFQRQSRKMGKNYCYVCQEKMRKKAMECVRCTLLAHQKCVDYCKKVVPCKATKEVYRQEREHSWVDLEGPSDKMYSDSKQDLQLDGGGDSVSISEDRHVCSNKEEDREESRYSDVDGADVTPPDSNSETEDTRSTREEMMDATSLSDFVDIITPQELEPKILDAQRLLQMLEEEKRVLSTSVPPVSKEDLEYKLQKLDAQIETTGIKLQEYKETMRKIYT